MRQQPKGRLRLPSSIGLTTAIFIVEHTVPAMNPSG